MSPNLKAVSLNTQWQESFKEIQCYRDEQVNEKLLALLSDKSLVATIAALFKSDGTNDAVNFDALKTIHTVDDFQAWVEANLFPVIEKSYQSLSVTGLDELDPGKAYVFVSNHRDIVMDPLILNKALRRNGFSTSNCAIGDNLLTHPGANDLALLNRCFKVFRSLKSPRAMFKAMKTQSEYIRYLHFTRQEHIWIAQKEGRAKDNIDLTNPALIKMFGLAKPKEMGLPDYLNQLSIVPVSISYEWDPCAIDKANELLSIASNSNYSKSGTEDFISTKKGLSENKGRIHVQFGKVLDIDENYDHKQVAGLIDSAIQQAYHPYPINYACYKKTQSATELQSTYTKQEVNNAGKQLDETLVELDDEVRKRVYEAYAQVLRAEN